MSVGSILKQPRSDLRYRAKQTLEFVSRGPCTSREVAQYFGVSAVEGRNRLMHLVNSGRIKRGRIRDTTDSRLKSTKANWYFATELLARPKVPNTERVLGLVKSKPSTMREIATALDVGEKVARRIVRKLVKQGELFAVDGDDVGREGLAPTTHVYVVRVPEGVDPYPISGASAPTVHRWRVLELLIAEDGWPLSVRSVAFRLGCTVDAARVQLESLADDRFIHRVGDEYEAYEEEVK